MKQSFSDLDIHNLVALIVIVFSFVFLFLVLFIQIPKENQRIVDMSTGAIIVSGFAAVISYLFGSSKKQKDAKN